MRIYRDVQTPIPMMLQPNHGEQIKIDIPATDGFVIQPENITTEIFSSFLRKFRPTLGDGIEMKILEIGEDDKDGLILIEFSVGENNHLELMHGEADNYYDRGWISLDDLACSQSDDMGINWSLTRRHENQLAGARLDEILNPNSDLTIRGQYRGKYGDGVKRNQEEMRRFVLEAVKAKYGEA